MSSLSIPISTVMSQTGRPALPNSWMCFICLLVGFWFCAVTAFISTNGDPIHGHLLQEKCQELHPDVLLSGGQILTHNRTHSTALLNRTMSHTILLPDRQFLYCYVPKVACTNWKRILMLLTGKSNATDPLTIAHNKTHAQS